jgi:hypothetical protein
MTILGVYENVLANLLSRYTFVLIFVIRYGILKKGTRGQVAKIAILYINPITQGGGGLL